MAERCNIRSVMNWYIKVLKNYAVFEGRSRRKEYWYFFLFNILAGIAIGIIVGLTSALSGAGSTPLDVVSGIYNVALLVPSIAVGIRRMHDTGHSGWWLWVPFANMYLLCIEGETQSNKYGPDPKA
jgi:uncharacterized membrane protein YhaH (DUF805 family)